MSFSMTVLPAALLTGISIAKTGKYRPQLWTAWVLLLVAHGLFTTVTGDTNLGKAIGFEAILGFGNGILQAAPIFPILAPVSVELSAQALSFFMFLRFLSQVRMLSPRDILPLLTVLLQTWGISIGGAIIQNELQKRLPNDIMSQLPTDTSIVYSIVQYIPTLDETAKQQIINDFAASMKTFWYVMVALAGLGFGVSLFTKALPLHTHVDRRYSMRNSSPSYPLDAC